MILPHCLAFCLFTIRATKRLRFIALLIFETFVEDYSEAKKDHTYNIAPGSVVLFFGAEVSGRDKAFLESYFGAYASFTLIAEHGLPSMSWG